MTVESDYITRDEAIAYIGQNASRSSDYVEALITGVSRDIDRHCGRRFYQHGTAEEPVSVDFAAAGLVDLLDFGRHWDLVSATTVKLDDGTGTFATELASGDYQLLPTDAAQRPTAEPYTAIRRVDGSLWPHATTGRRERIRITGVWGWPEVPEPIRITCRLMVARLAARPQSPLGLAGGFGEAGAMRVFGEGWDQDAIARMKPYSKLKLGFA